MILACNQLCMFSKKTWIQNKMPVEIHTSILEVNQEEVTALAHHTHQVCAVGDHMPHHRPPVCAVTDHVLPESREEQVKEIREPTKQELLVKTSQEAGFSNTVGQFDWVNSSEKDRGAMLKENGLYRPAKNSQNPDPLKRATMIKVFSGKKKVPFLTYSSQRIKVSCAMRLKCRHHRKVAGAAWIRISRGVSYAMGTCCTRDCRNGYSYWRKCSRPGLARINSIL